MKILTIAATALFVSAASGASAQTTAPAAPAQTAPAPAGPQGRPATDIPLLQGAEPAPDCGNLYGLNGKAFCVGILMSNVGTVAEAYISDLEAKGWLVAAGDNNRVVFIRRQEGGGCEGMQMQAFYDTNRPTSPTAVGYLGFATIPGNVCAAQPAATGPAQ
ncbi:hypothetical protein [Brevundimonas goettingensis]|uniref:Uncharacterized protein n=1 Tax=Brevundimonas goettingensis TaxID=2774190 RepID=A0A975BYZ6_9CAUL|nr:hypothetical protein [Brevundimonas goettingensis]QTC90391.1 hypothetical protein IFJ75_14045 [Brevundimonas goettingensis]